MIPVPGDAPPLVFLGPSAPKADVLALLPGAEIRPPVRRGDLYQARLLRYSVFVVIDGVFAQREAIPPREVVDVLQDGAAVVGASSMGALRAADCHPAGAIGIGGVYRAFRAGAISSEDEVAVVFDPDNPYPALSLSLVGIRFAVRRAVRAGRIDHRAGALLVETARRLPYADRTWEAVTEAAGVSRDGDTRAALDREPDIKRQDATAALRWIAKRHEEDPDWFRRPRRNRGLFSGMTESRERPADGLRGRSLAETAPGFLLWMLLSGRSNRFRDETALATLRELAPHPPDGWPLRLDGLDWAIFGPRADAARAIFDHLDASLRADGRFDGEHYRHVAIAQGIRLASERGAEATVCDIEATEGSLLKEHGVSGIIALEQQLPPGSIGSLRELIRWWSRAKAHRRATIGDWDF